MLIFGDRGEWGGLARVRARVRETVLVCLQCQWLIFGTNFFFKNLWGLVGTCGDLWGPEKMAAELYYSLAEARAGKGDRQTPFYITGYTYKGARAHLEGLSKPASPYATLCIK